MTASRDWNVTEQEQEKLNVLAHQAQQLRRVGEQADGVLAQIAGSVAESEALLERYGKTVNDAATRAGRVVRLAPPPLRPWEEVVMDAEANLDAPASFEDLLSFEEVEGSLQKVELLREDFNARLRLDTLEWCICGVAGSLAALVDVFLVSMPRHPGFLGGKRSEGGPLANWLRDKVNGSFTPAEIRQLEKKYPVPYDASISAGLAQPVPGLSPSTHRFQSLGHDPVLCWIFGVCDVLAGTFTAIDKEGRWVVQAVDGWEPSVRAISLFEGVGRVFGHLKSDIATPAGLPAPLMPLLQMFQGGRFGERGHTLGDLSRIMYRSGYDFRHFLAMSVVPLLVEVVVRLSYFAKQLYEGKSLLHAVPFELPGGERKPKLRTMLFVAHLIATAANAGKVAIGQNPLLINWSQWLAFVRYAVPQLKWVLFEKEVERHRFVQAALNEEWEDVCSRLNATWEQVFPAPVPLA
jgi:hypothetical protein